MNLLTPAEASLLGTQTAACLCKDDDTSYRAFYRAAAEILAGLRGRVDQVSIFTADRPEGDILHEEAIAGLDEGQGSDELPIYQLPDELIFSGQAVERRRGAYYQCLIPIHLGHRLIGLLSLICPDRLSKEELKAVTSLARSLAPAVGYVLQARWAERALTMLHAATRMSRELVGMSGMSSDRLLYHFVSLVVEHLKFDRATLVVYSPDGSVPTRAICATIGHNPVEIPASRLPDVPKLINGTPLELKDVPGIWVPISRGTQKLGALLADNIYSLERPPADAVRSLIDLTGQVALTMENTRLLERLQAMALRDDLTGLFRPGYFYERLQEELARLERERQTAALVFIDLDDFKRVNDTYGHRAGDALLVQIAHELRAVLRPSDVICRMGGDEFLVLIPRLEEKEAQALAERLCERIRQREFSLPGGGTTRVGASVGLSMYPANASDWQKLIHRADEAMYLAKRRGKGRVEVASNSCS